MAADVAKLAEDLAGLDDDEAARAKILKQLARLGQAATPAAPAVIALLGGVNEDEAFAALEAMTPESVAHELVAGLKDPKRFETARGAFSAIATRAYQSPATPLAPYLLVMRDTAVPAIIDAIKRKPRTRYFLPHPLGVIGANDEAAFATLVKTLGDKNRHARDSAVRGLEHFGDRAVPHIEKHLHDEFVDEWVVRVLDRIGTELALASLKKAVRRAGFPGKLARDAVARIERQGVKPGASTPPAKPAAKSKKPVTSKKPNPTKQRRK